MFNFWCSAAMLLRWAARDFHVFLWLVFIILEICPDALGEKLLLFPTVDELLIQEGNELGIKCYSEETRLQFSFPKYTFSASNNFLTIVIRERKKKKNVIAWKTHHQSDSQSPRSPHQIWPPENEYGTWTFLRRNAVSLDTGWYACAAEGVEIENHLKILNHTHDNIAWIYVYVNSSEPFTDRYYSYPKTITILDGSPGIVPCRPTSPDLIVQLWKNYRIIDSNEQISYDPKIGFVVEPPSRWYPDSIFQCNINGMKDEYVLQYSNVKGRRPQMNPTSEELVLREGDELRIECYGGTDINFEFPHYPGSPPEILLGENGKKTLLRKNVLSRNTGWYMCKQMGMKAPETSFYMDYASTEINWIYVYVESSIPDSLLYFAYYNSYELSSSIAVPCRFSSPSFNVSLKSDSKVGIIKDDRAILTLNENVRFDPRYGFYVRRAPRQQSFCYQCVAPNGNQESQTCFERKVDVVPDSPQISGEFILLAGESLFLNCHSGFFNKAYVEWSIPTTVQKKRLKYKLLGSLINDAHHLKILEISNVTKNESGEYSCIVRTPEREYKSLPANINVYDWTINYININGSDSTHAFVESLGQAVKWIMSYKSIFYVEISWFSPAGNDILPAKQFIKIEDNLIESTYESWLIIYNLTFEDAGLYTVNVTLIDESHTSIRINITLDIEGPLYLFHSENYQLSTSAKAIAPWRSRRSEREDEGSSHCEIDEIGRFGIIGPLEKMYIGDNVTLTCVGSIYEFQNLSWYEESDESFKIANQKMFNIEQNNTQYLIPRVLSMKTLPQSHRKSFTCLGETITGNTERTMYHLNLNTPEKPTIFKTTLKRKHITFKVRKNDSNSYELSCCAHGNPIPIVSWFKDGIQLNNTPEYEILPKTCMLVVHLGSREKKSGRYICRAENRFGLVEDYLDLKSEAERDIAVLASTIAAIFVPILALIAWLVIRKRRAKMSRLRLQEEILNHFEEGALDYLDPNLDVADQAEVLPYDDIWEYPQNKIKFGKILGSGAFGIVRRAEAKDIRPGEPFTTVAVKMVQARSTLHHMTALSRELKVLVHLGQHLNIINLLGACTKNISYGELFVIIEFCRFGNLKDYLSRRKADFIDQVDPVTGEINIPDLNIDNVSFNDSDNGPNVSIDCDGVSVAEGSCRSQDSTDTEAEEIPCEASVKLGLRSRYDGDDTDNILVPIRTRDLLCWAWQVSRGMRFLGVRKVVHGDLAARNILLADNNVIKICDLGLAKAILNEDHYNKEEEEPLPVKWMAIEALRDRRFSIESDVWSFGVVLWEFFTLAQSPYPEIHPGRIYHKLIDGYGLDKPKYAPKNMYRLMMNCWKAEPSKRPSFKLIETLTDESLDDSVRGDYLDSGNEYCSYIKSVKKDYLTMDPSQ